MAQVGWESIPVAGIPEFWERLAAAGRKYLVLDYDGTLAPFRVDRMSAFPLDGVVGCLSQIRDNAETRLAIMSGRPVDEILKLVGDIGITIVGSQGWEVRQPDGERQTIRPSAAQQGRLVQAARDALASAAEDQIETKSASVALHTRGMAADAAVAQETEVARLWSRRAHEFGMECRRFDGGVELRIVGTDKGTALRDLMRNEPPETFRVYLGDDDTDEDAFREIAARGWGIRVGPATGPTLAAGRLRDCHDVLRFLREWIHVSTDRPR
jgi:trehalose-phosphatase